MTGLTQQTSARTTSATLNDGTLISLNDHVYMASEFTGESYYVGRIMEFGKPIKGKPLQVRVGWFYRPKDVMARRNYDSRLLVATMHSDMNPVTSIRGRCTVFHQSYIKDLDAYKKLPDHFYYSQLFDRYIHRFYDVLPVESVRNLPQDVAEELGKRYQYIVVEAGTSSEYTDAHRVCLICKRWCASGEALKCIMCHGFHHMLCINPPMLRKPSKGFAFQCALCTKLAMDSPSTVPISSKSSSVNNNNSGASSGQNSPRGSPKQNSITTLTVVPTAIGNSNGQSNIRTNARNVSNSALSSTPMVSQGEKMSHMWPFRYFGTHADIQDIFDPDDRVYPRASSRVGARYQAAVVKWEGPGQILVTSTIFDDPQNTALRGRVRKGGRGGRPPNKQRVVEESTESQSRAHSASLDVGQDGQETPGTPSSPARSAALEDSVHTERGGDDTVTLLYSRPSHVSEDFVTSYLDRVKKLENLPLPSHSADLIDKALNALQRSGFDADKALEELAKVNQQTFDLKDWSQDEIEAFEEGIRVYGHELFAIKKKVETRSMKDIVRFFYQWKKTERYRPVYSVFTNVNKPNKKFKSVGRGEVTSPVLGAANRSKAAEQESGVSDTILDFDAIILPTTENHGKFECAHCGATSTTAWRRAPGETDRQNKYPKVYCNDCGQDWVRYVALPSLDGQKENSKKSKKDKEKDKDKDAAAKLLVGANGSGKSLSATTVTSADSSVVMKRKRAEPKSLSGKKIKEQSCEPTGSPSPTPEVPCAVCDCLAGSSEPLLQCHGCHLVVHRDCYGVSSLVPPRYWYCDPCLNNQSPTCSTTYDCVLCTKSFQNGPQALKRTTGNNWAHILCAIWIPETNFVDVNTFSPIESIGKIRLDRWKQACSICKKKSGACVGCGDGCKRVFHVSCARDAGYKIAFEMQPTRTVKAGIMVPMVWCPNHDLSARKVIQIRDQPDAQTDRTALQTYAHYYKQCDISVPGSLRKCRLLMAINPGIGGATSLPGSGALGGRRVSHTGPGLKGSLSRLQSLQEEQSCMICLTNSSPIWWSDSKTVAATMESTVPALPEHGSGTFIKQEQDVFSLKESADEVPVVCHACHWDQ